MASIYYDEMEGSLMCGNILDKLHIVGKWILWIL